MVSRATPVFVVSHALISFLVNVVNIPPARRPRARPPCGGAWFSPWAGRTSCGPLLTLRRGDDAKRHSAEVGSMNLPTNLVPSLQVCQGYYP
jgi:hypothetical protein